MLQARGICLALKVSLKATFVKLKKRRNPAGFPGRVRRLPMQCVAGKDGWQIPAKVRHHPGCGGIPAIWARTLSGSCDCRIPMPGVDPSYFYPVDSGVNLIMKLRESRKQDSKEASRMIARAWWKKPSMSLIAFRVRRVLKCQNTFHLNIELAVMLLHWPNVKSQISWRGDCSYWRMLVPFWARTRNAAGSSTTSWRTP